MNNNGSFLLGDKKMSCTMKLSFFSSFQEFHGFSCCFLIFAFPDKEVAAVHQGALRVRIVNRCMLEVPKWDLH